MPNFTVRFAVRTTPLRVPVMVTTVSAATYFVEIVKFRVVWPPGTVTGETTVATALLLELTATLNAEAGADVSVTVPVAGVPFVTDVGLMLTD